MSDYFINITKNFKLKRILIQASQPLNSIIHLFKYHKSIERIKLANIADSEQLHFSKIAKAEVKKEILDI